MIMDGTRVFAQTGRRDSYIQQNIYVIGGTNTNNYRNI